MSPSIDSEPLVHLLVSTPIGIELWHYSEGSEGAHDVVYQAGAAPDFQIEEFDIKYQHGFVIAKNRQIFMWGDTSKC